MTRIKSMRTLLTALAMSGALIVTSAAQALAGGTNPPFPR